MAKTIRTTVSFDAKFVVSDKYIQEVRDMAAMHPETKVSLYLASLDDEQLARWIVKKYCECGTKALVQENSDSDVRIRTSPTRNVFMERVDG